MNDPQAIGEAPGGVKIGRDRVREGQYQLRPGSGQADGSGDQRSREQIVVLEDDRRPGGAAGETGQG